MARFAAASTSPQSHRARHCDKQEPRRYAPSLSRDPAINQLAYRAIPPHPPHPSLFLSNTMASSPTAMRDTLSLLNEIDASIQQKHASPSSLPLPSRSRQPPSPLCLTLCANISLLSPSLKSICTLPPPPHLPMPPNSTLAALSGVGTGLPLETLTVTTPTLTGTQSHINPHESTTPCYLKYGDTVTLRSNSAGTL